MLIHAVVELKEAEFFDCIYAKDNSGWKTKTLRRYTYGIISGFLLHVTVAALAMILNTHPAFKNGDCNDLKCGKVPKRSAYMSY